MFGGSYFGGSYFGGLVAILIILSISARDSEITGKQSVNSERDSEIEGVATSDERDSEITGKLDGEDERDSEILGKQYIPLKRRYRILVKDENDDFIGEFDKFRRLRFGKRLNNYGTAEFEIPVGDAKTDSLIALRKYTVWIYYQKDADTTLVWAGEQAAREGNLDDKGNNWCTIHCFTWLEQLNSRYTDSERIFTAMDAGEIAWTLIDETQTQTNGDFGITKGSIEATIDRDRSYYNQNVMEAIINLANVLSGFDFEITDLKVFNVYQVMGSDKSNDIVLEYGHNIKSVKILEDFTKPINRALVLGESTGDEYTDPELVREEVDDATLQSNYKLREGLLTEMDVSELDTMTEKGEALIRKYGDILTKVDIDLASVQNPNITEFNLGDSITLVINSGIYAINEQFRVFEWEVNYNSNDVERLSLVLGNFTYD
jgi:hypothetical protein